MRFFTARRVALLALFPALLSLSVIPGCSQQGEGERCGDSLGVADSDDCGSGLTCTAHGVLLNGSSDMANRCCYADRKATDSRCTLAGASAAGASSGGAGGASAGSGDTAGAADDVPTPSEAGAGGV